MEKHNKDIRKTSIGLLTPFKASGRVLYQMEEVMSAFERGYLDGLNGKGINECPYRKMSGEAIAWRNGWREANGNGQ